MPKPIVSYDRSLPLIPDRDPYSRPESYLEKEGDDYTIVSGRRASGMLLVEKLRREVLAWRSSNYTTPSGISDTTRRLLTYWFEEDHIVNKERFGYYFCQREAIETLIFLFEVKGYADLKPVIEEFSTIEQNFLTGSGLEFQVTPDGKRSIRRYSTEHGQDVTQDIPEPNLLRYAFKMATGSGKTLVMALAVVWSYFNRIKEKEKRFADNFLIIAPNVIVLERLQRDFIDGAIFRSLPLIPPEWIDNWNIKVIGRGNPGMPKSSGTIFIQNIQQLQSRAKDKWDPQNVVQKILGKPAQTDIDKPTLSILDRVMTVQNLMVMNDEAHHVHDEELEWTKTLLTIHHSTPGGLKLWLDFSATPKDQNGSYYPWIVVDYPLAQAVEDLIVKVPIIVHRVTNKDPNPERITQENVAEVYTPWIISALERWKVHRELYAKVGKKPVLFIMAEKNAFADTLAEMIKNQKGVRKEEVLVIHTDLKGEVRTGDIEELRKTAMDIDKAKNKIKIIVSVLMLREGWDVQNVTVILGLRPFTSKAQILPEQAVGRGLRLMTGISPDNFQVLEVIGTKAFEDFVKLLETEGVGIRTVENPIPSIVVEPLKSKIEYDVEIPQTELQYSHNYKVLSSIDPMKIDSLLNSSLPEDQKIRLRMEFPITETVVGESTIRYDYAPPSSESIARITSDALKKAKLVSGRFSDLYPIVNEYISKKCFGKVVDLESAKVRKRIADPIIQNEISNILAVAVGQAVVEQKPVVLKQIGVILSKTIPYTWRRKHVKNPSKSIFNYVATFNNFESHFAEFLDRKDNDIVKFAAFAETFTGFKIDYLSKGGGIRFYYPDFVAVQKTPKGVVNWIIETKGREYPDTEQKEAAMTKWCKDVSIMTKEDWRTIKVPQEIFEKHDYYNFEELVRSVRLATTVN